MARVSTPIAGTSKVKSKNVTALGKGGLYFRDIVHGRVFIPKDFGMNDGDVLNGNVSFETATYDENADGTKRAEPLVRVELLDYVSTAAEIQSAIDDSQLAAIPTMKWSAADFMKAPVKAVTTGD